MKHTLLFACAIIGGTITSTLLTLLVVPTFYDSIEIARDRMVAKYGRRAVRLNPLFAFLMTFVEAILTLTLVRLLFRLVLKGFRFATGRGRTIAAPAVAPTVALDKH